MSEKEKNSTFEDITPDTLDDAVQKERPSVITPEEVDAALERARNPTITGNCDMCGTEYVVKKGVFQHHDIKYTYQPCPSCDYNPGIEKHIERIIDLSAEFTLRAGKSVTGNHPSIKVNSKELSDRIVNTLKDYWPKPE